MAFPNLASMIPIISSTTDGPTLTAASAASAIPTANKLILPTNYWTIGKHWHVRVLGRQSCAVTTPGTCQWQLRLGPTGTISVFDSGALGMNIVVKNNVPFLLEIDLTCRAVGTGTSSNLMGIGRWQSEACVGSGLPTVGGNGSLMVPVGAPAVGTGFDNTAANTIDLFYTPSLSTASMTVHSFQIWEVI